MSDKESQKDELCALESIYNNEELQISEENGQSGGQFYAHIDLSTDFKIVYRDLRQDDSITQEMKINFLPPLVLYFSLPDDYPSKCPPNFTLSCQWLKKDEIMKICRKLDAVWEENKGMEILFLWTQFLKEEALKFLDVTDTLEISRLYTFYLRTLERIKERNAHRAAACRAKAAQADKKKVAEEKKRSENTVIDQSHRPAVLGSNRDGTLQSTHSKTGEERRRKPQQRPRRGNHSNHRYNNSRSLPPREVEDWNTVATPDVATPDVVTPDVAMPDVATQDVALVHNSIEVGDTEQNPTTTRVVNIGKQREYLNGYSKENVQRRVPWRSRNAHYDERAVLDLSPQVSPVRVLCEYNEGRQLAVFNRNVFTCKVCFQDKLGTQCTRFSPCGHVFCRDCISSYLEVRIRDGSVHSIGCPEDKCTAEAHPSQVQDLVSAELFAKYDSVLLNAMLDTMTDILYCPRPSCQYPVSCEPNEKMATCPACHYAFCIFCKMVYHGVEPCRFKTAEKRQLVEEYQGAALERRLQLEQRYGKKQLQALVDTYMSEVWIYDNSKNCPHCCAAIEKSDGCNKMICWRCNTIFCWLCGVRLNPQCPYTHFNSTASQCYNKLFLGVPVEEEEEYLFDEVEDD